MSVQSSCESATTDESTTTTTTTSSPTSPVKFMQNIWGKQSTARASTSELPPRPPRRPKLPLRAASELPPALPESPEILVPTPRVTPSIPRNGTLAPSPLSGLMIESSQSNPSSPAKQQQHHHHHHHHQHSQSRKASLQPRRSSAESQVSQDGLGRLLPSSLTESLELLVQVRDHCRELERLGSVPEEAATTTSTSTPLQIYSLPMRKSSANLPLTLPPTPSRRVSEPVARNAPPPRCPSFPAAPHMRRTSSGSSVSSGDWPETPDSSSPYSNAGAAAMSMPALDVVPPLEFVAPTNILSDRCRATRAMRVLSTPALDGRPSVAKLLYATELEVHGEDGHPIKFGELIDGTSCQRTIVVFVRHWLSPSCGTYMKALIAQLTPPVLARARARVVVIGLGAASMIKGYRSHLQCPFPVYTDPGRKLHDVLGLSPRASGTGNGEYTTSTIRAARNMLLCAARMQGLRAGNRQQLGGEFIFEGPLQVLTAHRMAGASDHMPVGSLIAALSTPSVRQRAPSQRTTATRTSSAKAVPRSFSTRTPGGSTSCISLHDAPPLPGARLEFPLPPVPGGGARPSVDDVDRWQGQGQGQREKRLSGRSRFGRFQSQSQVAIVNPDDIDRVTGEYVRA